MNVFRNKKAYSIIAHICVFAVLVLPVVTFAQGGAVEQVHSLIRQLVYTILISIAGFFVWAGGALLDYSVTSFVAGFGDLYVNRGIGYSVDQLWSFVRDVFNLVFIFGLVFIGFKIIFGDNGARKTLATLIVAALLVNFSLFITKFVVDFTNIAAAQIANGFLNTATGEYDVSHGFMEIFGISSLLNVNPSYSGQGWIYIFLTFILFMVAAFVFAAGGILLTIRFVVLNIYMILSPMMFLGWVFPGFMGASKKYWTGFLERAFFAPAYVMMVYLSHQILANMALTADSRVRMSGINTSGTETAARDSFEQTVPFFLVATIFLIASLVVAQKMGAEGATTALAAGKRSRQIATGFMADKSKGLLDRAASMDPNKKSRSNAVNAVRSFTRASARAVNVVGGRDFLEGAATPYTSLGDKTKKRRAAQAARDAAARQKEIINAGVDAQDHLKKLNNVEGPLTEAQMKEKVKLEKVVDDMASAVAGLSTKMLEEMSEKQMNAVSKYLTNGQVENIMKSDNISSQQKDSLTKARQDTIKEVLNKTGTDMASQITKLSIDQIETMGEDWITKNVSNFSSGQMDDLKKSKKFTDFKKNQFSDIKKGSIIQTINSGDRTSIAKLFGNDKEVGKLPTDAFKSQVAAEFITPSGLQEKLKGGGLSEADQVAIRSNLQTYLDNPATPADKKAAWSKWVESSTYGAGFGLNVGRVTRSTTDVEL